jgi:hypothetical protein
MPNKISSLLICIGALAMGLVLSGCAGGAKQGSPLIMPQCVEPPLTTSELDRTNALQLSAALTNLQLNASIQANFEQIAKASYATISNANTTLIILINGANCVGKFDKDLAKKLIDAAYKLALAQYGIAGSATTKITPTQYQMLMSHPGGTEAVAALKEEGYELEQ